MFKNLLDFNYKRTPLEAIGFYIIFWILGFIIGALLGGLNALIFNLDIATASSQGIKIGAISSVIYSLALSIIIIVNKRINDIKAILLLLLSGIGALFMGCLLGLIPVAILTTFASYEQ